MRKLLIYKGFTVDFLLKEFRKAIVGETLEFVPFESPKGQKLLDGFLLTKEGRREQTIQS